ncbi:unnamed protein product [Clavelina lepadiformis]|uniref:Uncharacterized protein n=1 Tax=Clavelina lepadiformis TaxID=159417 RepID=A0ABP0GL18_CLALP
METNVLLQIFRAFHSGCQVNSQFYAVGGATGSILCVEFYDPHKSGWTWLKKNVPRMMYNFTTSGCNSKLILIGSGQSSSVFLQCYNPAIDQWTVVRSPNVPRHLSAPVSATLADESKIFVSGDNTKKLYAFDPNKNSWSRAADMNNLHSNGNLVLLGNELFHTGGHWEEDGYWDEMESYDIAQNTWNPRGALPHLWLYHGCAAIFINE